jgi:glutamate--cysteine ligase
MSKETKITEKSQLVQYIEQGCKDPTDWSIGTENEQFVFQTPELVRAPYEGPRGINALLKAFENDDWQQILEKGHLIALKNNGANISLEPAGQFELSGATLKTLHDVLSELQTYHQQLYGHLNRLGLGLLSQGLDPKTPRDHMPWMPKQRYDIMKAYMPTRGNHGLDMMTATCTVQVNLDYSSERDLAKKFRVSMALQPLVTAMFANSPIREGRLTGYKSYRAFIWTDTDPDRSGLLSFAFEEDFTFEKYVDYVLDVPMYFVYRDGIYHNHAGDSFKTYMKGELPGFKGQVPLIKDFEDHLTTAFPEVRIKQYMEMRGADSGSMAHMEALAAFWTGLLYDQDTLDEVYEMTKNWTYEECLNLKNDVLKQGLQAMFRGHPLHVTAAAILDLAKQGLQNRACYDTRGRDESMYLCYLQQLVDKHECPADALIKEFTEKYHGDVDAYLRGHIHQGPENSNGLDPWEKCANSDEEELKATTLS